MIKLKSITLCAIALLFILSPAVLQAHKLRIFAWPEGNIIHGETAFSGKRKPINAEITVLDAANRHVLLTLTTDTHGKFSFPVPQKALSNRLDLLLVVTTGEGHRGEWPLPADEYIGLSESPDPPPNTSAATDNSLVATKKAPSPIAVNQADLRRLINEELEIKLAPIRQQLARQSDHGPRLIDILAGIGCILGLAGLIAWLQTKKQQRSD